jgi:hypothetical protein
MLQILIAESQAKFFKLPKRFYHCGAIATVVDHSLYVKELWGCNGEVALSQGELAEGSPDAVTLWIRGQVVL